MEFKSYAQSDLIKGTDGNVSGVVSEKALKLQGEEGNHAAKMGEITRDMILKSVKGS